MKKFPTNLAMLRNVLFHSLLIFFTFFSFVGKGWGQVTVTNPSNTTPALSNTYASLALAITAVNNRTAISGPVTITLDASTPQTAPAGGYSITNTAITGGSNTNRFIFDGGGNTITAPTPQTSGNLNDAIFKIIGADFITIQNFTMQENASNTTTTAASNNMTEFGVALFYASTTNGAQNNIIQNNTITLNRAYQNTFGIFASSRTTAAVVTTAADATSAAGANSNNKIYSNIISNLNYAIVFLGSSTIAGMDIGNDIGGSSSGTGNTISNFCTSSATAVSSYVNLTGSNYAIFLNHNLNSNVSYNSITSASSALTATLGGILQNFSITTALGTTVASTTLNNNTITLSRSAAGTIFGVNNQGLTTSGTASTITMNNNQILNVSITITGTSAVTGVANSSITGVLNMNGNTVRGITSAASAGQILGVVNSAAVITSINMDNNKCGDATAGYITYSAANSGLLLLAANTGSASTCAVSMQNNDIRGVVYGVASTANNTYIQQTGAVASANISNNTFTNLNINTTGSVTFINHNYTIPSTGQMVIDNNSIVTGFTRTAAGSVTLTSTNGSSATGAICNYTNNNFSNITVPDNALSNIIGFNNTDGGAGSTKTITGNTFNNWHGGTTGTTGTSGTINCMNFTYWNGVSSLSNNTITNITCRGAITGVTIGSTSSVATSIAVSGNIINNLASIGTGDQVLAISCSNTSTTININGNTINNLSSTATSSAVGAISVFGATTTNVYQNVIYDISTSGTTAPIALGIQVAGGTLVNVYRNKIYNLSASGSSLTSLNSAVSGIYLNGGTTVNTYNNLIGNLTAPNVNLADAIRGINIISTTVSSSYNVYNNTVYLTGGSAGTNFGTSGIYHTASATATTAALNLQNNMIFNTCTPSGTGIVTAIRRSAAATLGNYKTTSNKNLLYAGTPSATNTIMSDGSNNYQTFTTFQTAVSTREANSFTESTFNPSTYFVSTTGSNANYLQPASGLTTQAEGGGNTITMCSPDYNGVTRPGLSGAAYDVGAWEFAGVSSAPEFTNMTPSPALTTQCTKVARAITIDITTVSGTITGATLNYSHNGAAQTAVTMTNSSGNTWTGTMLAPTQGNATVTWSITATNSLGLSTLYNGTSYSDEPTTGITASATATPSTVCNGSNSSLSLSLAKSGTGVIGSGTVSSSSSPTPFSGSYGGMKGQYIILASELISAGYSSGNITGLGINFTSTVTVTYTDLTIQIGNTSLSAFNSTLNLESGLTTVYGPTSLVNPVAGVNTFALTTPFNWDGVSNIIISTSWSNNANTSIAASVITTTTTSNLAQVHKRDSYLPASLLALTGAQSGGFSTVGTARPNFTIIGNQAPTPSAYSWSNGTSTIGTTNPLSTTVTSGTTFTVTATVNNCSMTASVTPTVNPLPTAPTATNSSQCGAGIPTASVADNNSYTTPTFKWYSAATGGTLLQTSTSATYTSSISTTTTFYVAVVGTNTCESTRTAVTVTVTQPDAISASTSASTICLGQSVTLTAANTASTPTQNYSYSWLCSTTGSGSTSANTNNPASITPTLAGSFTYTVTGTDGPCSVYNTVAISVNSTSVAGAVTAQNNTICQSAATTINLSGNTGSIQWQSSTDNQSFTNINGQTSASLNTGNLSNTTYYKAIVTSGVCSSATSSSVTITVNNPQVLTTTPGSICSNLGSVPLSATSSSGSTLNWYANSIGGANIAAASAFNTPNISSSTNFYVAAEQLIGSSSNVGPTNYSIGTSTTSNNVNAYLAFSVLNASTRLLSVDIFPYASVGSAFAISIQNSSGAEIFNTGLLQTTVASGQVQTVPIGFDLAVGTGYKILCSTNPTLYRNSTGYSYPYTNGNISITSANNSNYQFFYNWSFVSANQYCSSARSTVIATVTSPTSITASASSSTICSGSTTTLSVSSSNSGYSYSWSNSLGSGASVSASPTSSTTYTVTAIDNSGCTNTSTIPVTVNSLPSAISLTPSTTQNLCTGSVQSIVVGGGGGSEVNSIVLQENFNSATNNWTLTNSSTGGTPANAAWTLRSNNYYYNYTYFNSNDNSQFYMSNSDAQGSGGTTLTMLTSPSINTFGATTGTLSFYHYFYSSAAGKVEYSTNGINFTTIETYTVNTGSSSPFSLATVVLPQGALNQSSVFIRFKYEGAYDYYWAIDNVSVTIGIPNISFSPTTDLYTNAGATTAYTGTPTTVYSKPTANRTYTATATTAAGCSTTASVTINVAAPTQQTVASTDYIWKGTTSTAWGTLSNWTQYDGSTYTTPTVAPSSTSVVVIPANNTCVQNQPAIGSSTIEIQDFKIESGATTSLNSGSQLTVTGTLTNNGTLTIESGATFLQGPSSSLAGNGTYNVKQFVTGAGGATPIGRFWYMGVPVNNLSRATAFGAASGSNRLWSWSESGQAWSSQLGDATALTPTTGYSFRSGSDVTLNFSGTSLYSADPSISGLTNTTGSFSGCHLMSNPFTAYADWEQIYTASTNISSTYCVRSFNTANSQMVYDTYNATGDVAVQNGSYAVTRYIAPMQSFWIIVDPSTTGTFNMTKSMLSHQPSATGLKDLSTFNAFARLNLIGGNLSDQVVVYMTPDATNTLDAYDSKKMMLSNVPQVYTTLGTDKLVINGLKESKAHTIVPLTLELPTSQSYHFEMAESNVNYGLVILEDREELVFQDMTANPDYAFFAQAGISSDRFVLHFHFPLNTASTDEIGSSAQIDIVSNNTGAVNVHLSDDLQVGGEITVLDQAGRLVAKKTITQAQTLVQINETAGVYFVRVQTPGKTEMKKVVLY